MVVGDGGSFLKKYELDSLEIFRVYSSYLNTSSLQNSWQSDARISRKRKINFYPTIPLVNWLIGHTGVLPELKVPVVNLPCT